MNPQNTTPADLDLDFAMLDLPNARPVDTRETDKATRAAEQDDKGRAFRGEWYQDKGLVPQG